MGDYLNRGAIAQLEYVTSHGKAGTCLVFNPAVQQNKRMVWAFASFMLRNPRAYGILDRSMCSPRSAWSWFVGDNVEFVAQSFENEVFVWSCHVRRARWVPEGFPDLHDKPSVFGSHLRCFSSGTDVFNASLAIG